MQSKFMRKLLKTNDRGPHKVTHFFKGPLNAEKGKNQNEFA
jgi:hypothetical protein